MKKQRSTPGDWLFVRVRTKDFRPLDGLVTEQNRIYRTLGHALFREPLYTIEGTTAEERFLVARIKQPALPYSETWPFRWFSLGITFFALTINYYVRQKGRGFFTLSSGRRAYDSLVFSRRVKG